MRNDGEQNYHRRIVHSCLTIRDALATVLSQPNTRFDLNARCLAAVWTEIGLLADSYPPKMDATIPNKTPADCLGIGQGCLLLEGWNPKLCPGFEALSVIAKFSQDQCLDRLLPREICQTQIDCLTSKLYSVSKCPIVVSYGRPPARARVDPVRSSSRSIRVSCMI